MKTKRGLLFSMIALGILLSFFLLAPSQGEGGDPGITQKNIWSSTRMSL